MWEAYTIIASGIAVALLVSKVHHPISFWFRRRDIGSDVQWGAKKFATMEVEVAIIEDIDKNHTKVETHKPATIGAPPRRAHGHQ